MTPNRQSIKSEATTVPGTNFAAEVETLSVRIEHVEAQLHEAASSRKQNTTYLLGFMITNVGTILAIGIWVGMMQSSVDALKENMSNRSTHETRIVRNESNIRQQELLLQDIRNVHAELKGLRESIRILAREISRQEND